MNTLNRIASRLFERLVVVLFSLSLLAPVVAYAKPKIKVLATGGTIAGAQATSPTPATSPARSR